MISILSMNKNEELNFHFVNSHKKIQIWKDWKIWSYVWENIELNKDFEYKYSLIDSVKYWTLETYNQTLLTFKWLWILVRKIFNPETPKERTEALAQVSWPIWIVDFISHSMQWWFIFLIVIWAIISINLWVFNLLPIPALDWWRFLFITINGLIKKIFWRKAISEKTEWYIHVWFFIVLIALSLLIAYNDISKIIIR
jgi:membrane-associated protease RseP (regulator of RpoE activity)